MTETAKRADVVLPAVSFAERDGTYTNAERRVQRFYAALPITVDARPDWEIFVGHWAADGDGLALHDRRRGDGRARPVCPGLRGHDLRALDADAGAMAAGRRCRICTLAGRLTTIAAGWARNTRRRARRWNALPSRGPSRPCRRLRAVTSSPCRCASCTIAARSSRNRTSSTRAHLRRASSCARADADRLGIADGDVVTVTLPSGEREMTARVDEQAPQGAALVPAHITTNITLTDVRRK